MNLEINPDGCRKLAAALIDQALQECLTITPQMVKEASNPNQTRMRTAAQRYLKKGKEALAWLADNAPDPNITGLSATLCFDALNIDRGATVAIVMRHWRQVGMRLPMGVIG